MFPNPCTTIVVIPAYQAAATVLGVIADFRSRADLIIVVDDASTDETAELLRSAPDSQAGTARLEVIRHERNRGVGGAMKTGIARALEIADPETAIVVKVDSDGQMRARDLDLLLSPILAGEADAAKGNRWYHVGQLATMPTLRRLGNLALGFLTRLASGHWTVFDPTNGFLAWRAYVLGLVDLERADDRYLFETSMLVLLGEIGAVVVDVPIPARYGSETSHLDPVREIPRFALYLPRAFLGRVWKRYFVFDFTAVSVLLLGGLGLFTFGTVFGVIRWYESIRSGIPATAGTALLAALPVLLGFNMLLQAWVLDIRGIHQAPVSRRRISLAGDSE